MDKHTQLKQLFARAQQCIQGNDYQQAASAFRQATELDAGSFAAWCNLSAMYVELGQAAEAAEAARQALALKGDFGPAWANLGDALRVTRGQAEASFDAYRRAAALMPRSPEILTKLGAALQVRSQFREAAGTLRRALALAPGYREARINLCSNLIALGEAEEVRRVLAEGARLPGQDPAVQEEWHAGLELLAENLRLQPLLAVAVAQGNAERLAGSWAGDDRERPADEALVDNILLALKRGSSEMSGFTAWRPEQAEAWHAVEAHYSAHLGETTEAVAQTRALLAAVDVDQGAAAGLSVEQQDALRYYALCRRCRGDTDNGEMAVPDISLHLRYLHASLAWHRPEVTPGQFKIVPNSVTVNPGAIRTAPRLVAGTLAAIYQRCYQALQPGPLRAALVYYAIADIHPFPDGNGRLGRWLMNRELQAAGLSPVVYATNMKADFHKALWAIRRDRDFGPFVAWLADCDAYTRDIVSQLGA